GPGLPQECGPWTRCGSRSRRGALCRGDHRFGFGPTALRPPSPPKAWRLDEAIRRDREQQRRAADDGEVREEACSTGECQPVCLERADNRLVPKEDAVRDNADHGEGSPLKSPNK